MTGRVLIGWCTIHWLIWASLAVLAFWAWQFVAMTRTTPEPQAVTQSANAAPSSGETAVPSPSGRHRKNSGGTHV
jgi:hypothetical protein